MSDTLGAFSLPAAVPVVSPPIERTRSPGDPALVTLGSFAATVLQADCGAAWQALHPGRPDQPEAVDGERLGTGPVRRVWYSDPKLGYFSPEDLPGLFVYRTGQGAFPRAGADFYRRGKAIGLVWMPPRVEADADRRDHDPFFNAAEVALSRALVHRRHPAWILGADETDDNGLVEAAFATSTSLVTLSGGSLDGALAALTLTPGRPIQVTTGAAVGAYNTTDPILVTGVLDSGVTFTDRLYLTAANGGQTIVGVWSFVRTTQVVIPAQLLATGTFTLGFYASPSARLGSLVQRACAFTTLQARASEVKSLPVARPNEPPLPFRALELLLDVAEEHGIDPAEHGEHYDPESAAGLEAYINQGNNNPFNSFVL
jgi:hypothetical protein